jgi:hypothetical protein
VPTEFYFENVAGAMPSVMGFHKPINFRKEGRAKMPTVMALFP